MENGKKSNKHCLLTFLVEILIDWVVIKCHSFTKFQLLYFLSTTEKLVLHVYVP